MKAPRSMGGSADLTFIIHRDTSVMQGYLTSALDKCKCSICGVWGQNGDEVKTLRYTDVILISLIIGICYT